MGEKQPLQSLAVLADLIDESHEHEGTRIRESHEPDSREARKSSEDFELERAREGSISRRNVV